MQKLLLIPVAFFLNAQVALAQGEVDLDAEGVVRVLNRLAQFALNAAALVLVGFAGYYAIRIATAGSNATQVSEGKRGLVYSLIGALVIFGVGVIINSVRDFVSR